MKSKWNPNTCYKKLQKLYSQYITFCWDCTTNTSLKAWWIIPDHYRASVKNHNKNNVWTISEEGWIAQHLEEILLIFTQCTSNVNTFKAIQFQIVQKRSKFFDTSMVELNYEKSRPACISLSIELHGWLTHRTVRWTHYSKLRWAVSIMLNIAAASFALYKPCYIYQIPENTLGRNWRLF